jgi:CheY-like chemotaxis protein
LIVDDEAFNIEAIKIVIKFKIGVNSSQICDSALNGKRALEMIHKNVASNNFVSCDYNLILLDCNMPFMDGYETA